MVQLFFRPPIDLDQSSLHIPNNLLFLVASPVASASPLPGADEYDTDDDPDATRTAYYQALQFIGSLHRELRNDVPGPRLILRVLTWFTFLPDRFVRLASARRPRALLIMAHYLMFVKLIQNIWASISRAHIIYHSSGYLGRFAVYLCSKDGMKICFTSTCLSHALTDS